MRETWVWYLGQEDSLEKGMATHSSILAWRILWTEETGRLQSLGSQRVRHDGATNTFTALTFNSCCSGNLSSSRFFGLSFEFLAHSAPFHWSWMQLMVTLWESGSSGAMGPSEGSPIRLCQEVWLWPSSHQLDMGNQTSRWTACSNSIPITLASQGQSEVTKESVMPQTLTGFWGHQHSRKEYGLFVVKEKGLGEAW